MTNMNIWHWLIIGLGGGVGAMGRFALTTYINRLHGSLYPWGTFIVNALGCFIMGLAFVFFTLKYPHLPIGWRGFVLVGLLGAFTTFSSFALEGLTLLQQHQYTLALLYMVASVIICIIAVAIGFGAGKLIF
ncbi:fluoride efflux transporter CrcB [Reinekea forsetii]|nr:fluoride efflux transporter CrcB [Reinekea forsetii]